MSKPIVANGNHPTQATSDATKIAAIYARVSTTDQADKGYSLPTQIEACLAHAERKGYLIPQGIPFWRAALSCFREGQEKRKDEQHGTDKLRGIDLWNTIVQRLREQHNAPRTGNSNTLLLRCPRECTPWSSPACDKRDSSADRRTARRWLPVARGGRQGGRAPSVEKAV